MTVAFWAALLTGCVFAGFGLYQSSLRYAQWKRVRDWHDGDIVTDSGTLKIGQQVTIERSELHREDSSIGLSGYFVEVCRKTLVIHMETENGLPLNVQDDALPRNGETLLVCISGELGQYRFTTRLLDVRAVKGRPGLRLLEISRPFWLAHVQRRQHARIPWFLPVTLQPTMSSLIAQEGVVSNAEHAVNVDKALPQHATVLNLSAGGLRADVSGVTGAEETEQLLKTYAPDTILRIKLPLPVLSESLLLARVRECQRIVRRGGLGVQLACEFLPMSYHDQETLIAHIFRSQRENRQSRMQKRLNA